MRCLRPLLAVALLTVSVPASAAVIVLNFEGIPNQTAVANYYNGTGPNNYGISFSATTLALVDLDAGGAGDFANEPSASTIMFFLDASSAVLNVAGGFDTGFSFFYSSFSAASVNVYSGLNKTGTLLGTLNLAGQFNGNNCKGDPGGTFCNWSPVGVTFAGTARSIDFGGSANQTGFDDITFGSATPGTPGPGPGPGPDPGTPVPEPFTIGLLGMGLAAAYRRSRA